VARLFTVIQKGTNQRGIKILPSQLRRLPAPLLLYELEQELEGVSIAGDRMGTDLLLVDEPLGEERWSIKGTRVAAFMAAPPNGSPAVEQPTPSARGNASDTNRCH
jgi:hypothetical protein